MRAIPFFSLFGLIGLLSACTAKLTTPPPGPIALSGVVQLARVRNATVQAFALLENGEIASTVLAETITNENGEFQLSLPAGTGPVVIRSSGGKYENEADGVETDASELSNIVDSSKTSQVPVTALTTLAKERTLELLESSGSLENAQQAAKAQVGQLFGLSAEALDAIPAPPKEITLGTEVDAVQGALALAALSHFMKSYFPSKTISEVMSALIQDIKTDGSLNGDNEAGNLQSSLAQSLAFRWNTQRAGAVTAAKLNPNLAFKDFSLVEVSSLSFESQGLLHKTVVEGVYYLGGVKTTLPESGTGVWNDMFYSLGELGSGFFEGNCYVDGADTMSLVGGSGFCAGDAVYYLAGVATELNEEGIGTFNALYYQAGSIFSGETSVGITYENGAKVNGVLGDTFFVDGIPSWLTGLSDFSADSNGNLSAIKIDGSNIWVQMGALAAPRIKLMEEVPGNIYVWSASVVRSRNGEYTVALVAGYQNDTWLNYAAMVVYDSDGIEIKRFRPDAAAFHTDTWITMDISDSGRIAIVYQANGYNNQDQRLRLIDAVGDFDTGPMSFASYGECNFAPKVALNRESNNGVVTCQNHAGGPIYFRLFDGNGVFTSELNTVTYGTSWYDSHLVGMNDENQFVIVSTACSGPSTQAYFYDSEGMQVSVATLFNDGNCRFDTTRQNRVNLHVDSSGNFYLPWLNPGGDYGSGANSSAVSKFSPDGQLSEEIVHQGSDKFNRDESGNRYYLINGNIQKVSQ